MRKNLEDDVFYFCTMIEFVSRKTQNKCSDIITLFSDDDISHELKAAGVNHCLSFEQVCDEWIEQYHITEGNFKNISECKYEVPSVTAIGRVYQRLIFDVMKSDDLIETIKLVYSSFISDEISNYNSNLYYSNPDYLKCSYEEGMLLA
jgi:hypothetical protein